MSIVMIIMIIIYYKHYGKYYDFL